jgi:hypothetical protein
MYLKVCLLFSSAMFSNQVRDIFREIKGKFGSASIKFHASGHIEGESDQVLADRFMYHCENSSGSKDPENSSGSKE